MAARLVLIRHGESVLGSQGRYAGHSDTPLATRGHEQILKLRVRFSALGVREIWSSDLVRCRQTAEILGSPGDVHLTQELRELDFGLWEGLSHEEVAGRWRARYERWLENPLSVSPPQGESLRHLRERLRRFVSEIVNRSPQGLIALVTHGGPIRVILSPDLKDFWSTPVPPGSLTVVEGIAGLEGAS